MRRAPTPTAGRRRSVECDRGHRDRVRVAYHRHHRREPAAGHHRPRRPPCALAACCGRGRGRACRIRTRRACRRGGRRTRAAARSLGGGDIVSHVLERVAQLAVVEEAAAVLVEAVEGGTHRRRHRAGGAIEVARQLGELGDLELAVRVVVVRAEELDRRAGRDVVPHVLQGGAQLAIIEIARAVAIEVLERLAHRRRHERAAGRARRRAGTTARRGRVAFELRRHHRPPRAQPVGVGVDEGARAPTRGRWTSELVEEAPRRRAAGDGVRARRGGTFGFMLAAQPPPAGGPRSEE